MRLRYVARIAADLSKETHMRTRVPLLASMCLATVTLAPLAASAAPTSAMTSVATASADTSLHAVTYYGWRDREWRRERHYRHGGYCERLRRACAYKYERGEVGEGNCRRYRSECGRRY
jgi:hypothetical protein